jgi:Ion transport protein
LIGACIVLSTAIVMLEFLPRYKDMPAEARLKRFREALSILFLVEITLRLIACPHWQTFVKDINNWIDAMAFVPALAEMVHIRPNLQ